MEVTLHSFECCNQKAKVQGRFVVGFLVEFFVIQKTGEKFTNHPGSHFLIDELEKSEQLGGLRKPLNKLIVLIDLFLEIEQILLLQIQKLLGFEGVRIYPD